MTDCQRIAGRPLQAALAVLFAIAWGAQAHAARIPGGRDAATDCFAEFEILGTATQPPGEDVQVACTDCDPSCDKDGVAVPNGSCTFEASLCLNQSSPGCTPAPLGRVKARASQLAVPDLTATACGGFTSITLQTRPDGLRPASRRLRATALSSEMPRRVDRNRVKLLCFPRPAGEACPIDVREPCAASFISRNRAPTARTKPFLPCVDATTDRSSSGDHDQARRAVSGAIQRDLRVGHHLDLPDTEWQ